MKKVLILFAALFISLQANAQLRAEVSFVHAFEHWTEVGTKVPVSSLDGFQAGIKWNFPFDNLFTGFSFEPGANLSFLFGQEGSSAYKASELSLNVPIHARYTLELVRDFSLYGLIGPTLQFGFAHTAVDSYYRTRYPLYNQNNATTITRNPFNLYLGVAVGAEIAQMIHVNIGVDLGLVNQSVSSYTKISRNVLRVGVGYIF